MKMLIQDDTGHSEINVPNNQAQEKIEEQLGMNKWVTVEKKNGTTETLTKEDIPVPENKDAITDEERAKEQEWANKFKELETSTSTNKVRGG